MPFPNEKNPDREKVTLQLENGEQFTNITSYTFRNDFLTPVDHFTLNIGLGEPTQTEKVQFLKKVAIGNIVKLTVDGTEQATCVIDELDIQRSRGSGLTLTIEGRNRLGLAMDSGIDPKISFDSATNLFELLDQVFRPFGFTFVIESNDDARNLASGNKYGNKLPKAKHPKKLTEYTLHQVKPLLHEGAYEFAMRVCKRNGLQIVSSPDGNGIIAAKPDFDQGPIYQLRRRVTDSQRNNIISGGCKRSGQDQPSIIFAQGYTGGTADFTRTKELIGMVNPVIGANVSPFLEANREASFLLNEKFVHADLFSDSPIARPMYLHDAEARTPEELQNFLRREMASRLRKSMTCNYTVAGHVSNNCIWTVDTVVDVADDDTDVQEPMWILSRTLSKSRGAGTTTTLELVRLNSIVL